MYSNESYRAVLSCVTVSFDNFPRVEILSELFEVCTVKEISRRNDDLCLEHPLRQLYSPLLHLAEVASFLP